MRNGRSGVCPDWYRLIRAAKFMGIAPWELMEQSAFWMDAALTAESAEIGAQNQQEREAADQARRTSGNRE